MKPTELKPLASFSLASTAGNEHEAMAQVAAVAVTLGLSSKRIERLKTAVAEATMNATEHGNHFQPEVPVLIEVLGSETALAVRITDSGGDKPLPPAETPDIEAKLAGLQKPRGWGLFLMSKMVDEVNVTASHQHHTVELVLNLEGEDHEWTTA